MKKIAIIAVVAIIAGVASADLSVDWKNNQGAVTSPAGGSTFLVGAQIDLIWSVAGAITDAGAYNVTLAGETVLDSQVTGANSLWSDFGGVYVGDFTGGFFFTRIYDNTGSQFFLDIPMAAGVDYVYNPTDGATTFSDSVITGGNIFNVNQNNTTVVPEPATVGLFGLGALSAWIVRRNKMQAREEV